MRLHFSSASTLAMASPMPREAPVIKAVRPFSPSSMKFLEIRSEAIRCGARSGACDRGSGVSSVRLDAGRLHLPRLVVQVVADELPELLRRHVGHLHGIGGKNLLHLGRA